jgi:hypothetical protein
VELRKVAVLVDPDHGLHQRAVRAELVHPVRQRRGEAPELSDEVGVPEHPILEAHAGRPRVRRARPQHEPWKIDRPPMRGRIGAMVEAELALVAEVDDFLDVSMRQLLDIAVHAVDVDSIEHDFERRTQRQTPPTPVTDVVDAPQLPVDVAAVPKLGCPDIKRIHD